MTRKATKNKHNLPTKEGSLFVLFVCHVEISQTIVPLVALLVLLESPQ
jgi:hypothetical protein